MPAHHPRNNVPRQTDRTAPQPTRPPAASHRHPTTAFTPIPAACPGPSGSRLPLTAYRLPRPAPPPPVFRGHGCRTGLPPFPSRILPFHGCVSRLRPLPDSCAAIAPYSHEAACLPACLPVRNRSPAAAPSPAPHTLSAGAQKTKRGRSEWSSPACKRIRRGISRSARNACKRQPAPPCRSTGCAGRRSPSDSLRNPGSRACSP